LAILYRTRAWLTLAQLLPAWAKELAGSSSNASEAERDLTHILIEDIINGRLDDAGPLENDRRLGLRLITPENRAGYIKGHQARELLFHKGQKVTPSAFAFAANRLLVTKEAVLDFAQRHELPLPSWWINAVQVYNGKVASGRNKAQQPRGRRRPAIERAQSAIEALYSNGVPDQATEPNSALCQRVGAKLKELKLPDVSDDTILRAAGRRK